MRRGTMVYTDISVGPQIAGELADSLAQDLRARGCQASTETVVTDEATTVRITFDARHDASITFTTFSSGLKVKAIVRADGSVVEDLGERTIRLTGTPDAKVRSVMAEVRAASERLAVAGE
jgi:hypothetical protein